MIVSDPAIARAARFRCARDQRAARKLFRDDLRAESFAITLAGRLIGIVTLYPTVGRDSAPDDTRLELAYMVNSDYQGRGYMTRALARLIKGLKRRSQVRRLVAVVADRNVGSKRVLEKNRFVSYDSNLDLMTGREDDIYQLDL